MGEMGKQRQRSGMTTPGGLGKARESGNSQLSKFLASTPSVRDGQRAGASGFHGNQCYPASLPHAMSQFIRGKQVGVQRDFSAGLDPATFAADIVSIISSSLFRQCGQNSCSLAGVPKPKST